MKKLVICYEWRKLIEINPVPWGYSLHLTPAHFTKFLQSGQANKILSKARIDIILEPHGKPFTTWVTEELYDSIVNSVKKGKWGTLHASIKMPQVYEIFENLDLINKLFTDSEADLDKIRQELAQARLEQSEKELTNIIDFLAYKKKKEQANT